MDVERNERLARIMGWRQLDRAGDVCWVAPNGINHDGLPDLSGDDCAAVKYLLPFTMQPPFRFVDLKWSDPTVMHKHGGWEVNFRTGNTLKLSEQRGYRECGESLSLALSSAVERITE